MKKSYFSESGKKKFFKRYGYYVALGVCVLSVGVAGWAAVQKMSSPPVDHILSTSSVVTTTGTDKEAGIHIGGVESGTTEPATTAAQKGEEKTTSSMTTTVHTKTTMSSEALNAQARKPFESYYMAPIGNGVSKAYSNGELVYSETMNDWRVHTGTDFKAEKDAPVKAINDGIVLDVYEDSLMGVVVEINHGNGVVARYCGLAKNPPVKKDTMVSMGDAIGVVGEMPMESLEQYHLHLEVKIDGKAIDPETLFKSN